MSQADIYTKRFISQNDVFADVFNFFLFGGERVINPESLHDENIEETAWILGTDVGGKNVQSVQKFRNVLKTAVFKNDGRTFYIMLGVENQSSIHNAMPVRNAIYDFLQYGKQVDAIAADHRRKGFARMSGADFLSGVTKEDRLIPVITLVVYFGAQKWDAPLSLHDMMNLDDRLSPFVPDYKINLIEPATMSDEDIAKFATDFGYVMLFLKHMKDKSKIMELLSMDNSPYSKISTEAAFVLNSCANIEINIGESKEETDMCQGIKEWVDELIAEALTKERQRQQDAQQEALTDFLLNTARSLMKNLHLNEEQVLAAMEVSGSKRDMLISMLQS